MRYNSPLGQSLANLSQSFDLCRRRLRRRFISMSQGARSSLDTLSIILRCAIMVFERADQVSRAKMCRWSCADQGDFPGSIFSEAGEFQDAVGKHDAALGVAFDFRAERESQVDIVLLKFARQQAGRSLFLNVRRKCPIVYILSMDSFSVTKSVPSSAESKLFRTWAGIDKRFWRPRSDRTCPERKVPVSSFKFQSTPSLWLGLYNIPREIKTSLPTIKNSKNH